MANKITLSADTRKVTGRKVKTLRAEGILPANVFGKKIKSETIQVAFSDFKKVFEEAGETQIVELVLGGKKRPVLVANVQVDPVTDDFIHADFHEIDLKEKVTATVPVELTGEAPAEKEGLGILVQLIQELDVEALPAELPESLEVDISGLAKVDDAVLVKDLKLDRSKVEIDSEEDAIVAKIEEPQKEEEPEPAPAAEGEEGEAAAESPAEGQEGKEKEGSEQKPEEKEKKEE